MAYQTNIYPLHVQRVSREFKRNTRLPLFFHSLENMELSSVTGKKQDDIENLLAWAEESGMKGVNR